jgi:hypothetical protein
MTQMHAINRRVDAVRPTNDVDIVVHIETTRGMPNATADALEQIGYKIKANIDPRNNVGHRFTRGTTHIDVVTSGAEMDEVEDTSEVGAIGDDSPSARSASLPSPEPIGPDSSLSNANSSTRIPHGASCLSRMHDADRQYFGCSAHRTDKAAIAARTPAAPHCHVVRARVSA